MKKPRYEAICQDGTVNTNKSGVIECLKNAELEEQAKEYEDRFDKYVADKHFEMYEELINLMEEYVKIIH